MSKSLRELKKTLLNIEPEEPSGFAGFLMQYFRALRFYFLTGLMVWIPLIVTVWLTWWLFKNVGLGIENLIEGIYGRLNEIGERVGRLSFLQELEYRRGLGFMIAIALFLTTGVFARYLIGRRIIGSLEGVLQRIPGVRGVYKAVVQIRDVFVNRDGAVFQKVVLIQYPRPGIYAMAFQTSEQKGSVHEAAHKDLVAVFMPTTPNPTSGFLLYVDPAEVVPVDLRVEEAMKLIVSGGAYDPRHATVEKPAPKWIERRKVPRVKAQ